jgi:hypothetical protein
MSFALAGMNFRIHKGNSQSVADRFRFSSAYGHLNQIVPVFFLHKWKAGEKQTGRALPLSRQYAPFSGTPKPHTLSNKGRISSNADGLIVSRKPCLDLQDWQQQPRRFSLMALHVFPLKLHPKSIFAVFSAIASRASQVSPKSGALDTFLRNSARS